MSFDKKLELIKAFRDSLFEEMKKLEEQYKEQIDHIKARWDSERRFYEAIIEVLDEILLGKRPIEDIVKITCYGNIAYCCGLEKPCPFRNLALEILGISKEEYKELKEMFGKLLIDSEKRKKLMEVLSSL